MKISFNRKNTLRALKNFFGVRALSEKSIEDLNRKYFIGNKVFSKTYETASYKNLLKYLKDYCLEHYRNVELMYRIISISNAYTLFLCEITEVNPGSNDYLSYVRKFDEVLKEFYEFAVAHKRIIELKSFYFIQPLKTKTKFAQVNFDYSKKGLNFFNFDSLKELKVELNSWQKKNSQVVAINCCFDFNEQNLKKMIYSSINKNVNSTKEFEKLCYDKFLVKTKAINNKKSSSYEDLMKAVYKRYYAFLEGKVSRTYFNQLCSKHDGSTDENGELLKCNICLGELEISTEVCYLPCGHFNCKTYIEEWFDIKVDNFDEYSFQTLAEEDNETIDVDDNNNTLEEVNGTLVGNNTGTLVDEGNDGLVKEDIDTLVDENSYTSDKDYNCSTFLFNFLLKPLRFLRRLLTFNDDYERSDKDEDKNIDEDSNLDTESETSDEDSNSESESETSDEDSNSESESETSEEDSNSDSDSETSDIISEATCLEKDDKTPDDVYWNEYVIIEEDQKQEARNQCPLCKHICS